jgi:transposase
MPEYQNTVPKSNNGAHTEKEYPSYCLPTTHRVVESTGGDMAKERISMRVISEVLRLHSQGMSQVGIAKVLRIGRSTVQDYLRRLNVSGMDLATAQVMSNEQLESTLFRSRASKQPDAAPLYTDIFEELRKPHATIAVIWEEYRAQHPRGYSYSYFCDLVRKKRKSMQCTMRQTHPAGEKTFVDFGDGPVITDATTGITTKTRMFVSVWGASSYVYAHVVPTESLEYFVRANRAAFEFYGCCPHAVVPDNLRAAVSKACRYEPLINPTYLEFARHYDTVILPARPRKPKDKAKVENAVGLLQRWIVFRLRNHVFSSIAEAQVAVLDLVKQFNDRPMKQWGKSRRELFDTLDKAHAKPLPDRPYVYAEWKHATVQFNYHVHFDGHDYSVPHRYIHLPVEIRATATMIEIFCKNTCIAQHVRSAQKHAATTVAAHMPDAHQKYAEWTSERIVQWAEKYGNHVKELVMHILQSRRYPEQAYKSCLGIIRLGTKCPDRLDSACKRALAYRAYSYRSVRTMLEKGLTSDEPTHTPRIQHDNVRGAAYFQSGTSNQPVHPVEPVQPDELDQPTEPHTAIERHTIAEQASHPSSQSSGDHHVYTHPATACITAPGRHGALV